MLLWYLVDCLFGCVFNSVVCGSVTCIVVILIMFVSFLCYFVILVGCF